MTTQIDTFIASGLAAYYMTHEPVEYERNAKLPEKFRSYKVPVEFQESYGAELIKMSTFNKRMTEYRKNQK